MKNSIYALVILLVCSLLYRLPQNESLTLTLTQGNCCNPPLHGPEVPRFPQNTQVNVFIDKGSGFTQSEIDLITEGIADWNNEPNNSGVTYNIQAVETSSVPPSGTNNTITVRYRDVVSTGTGGALLNMQRNSNGAIFGNMFFFKNIRDPGPASQPEQIRAAARHEIAHGIGLDNAPNCPLGSTIMNPAWNDETLITPCDNAVINTNPSYPAPTPAPTPTPTPCAELNQGCHYFYDCCAGTVCGNQSFVCIWCEPNPQDPHENCMSETCRDCYGQGGTYCTGEGGNCWTPIVIDVLGNGFNLTNANGGISFDDGFGTILQTAWTSAGSDDAWLVLDRNGNGTIDNGTELFGNAAPQPPPTTDLRNGFRALNEYDKASNGGNQDGLIDSQDSVFTSLRLWHDTNHDGISAAAELHSLSSLNLASIDLNYKTSKYKDGKGNTFRFRSKVRDAKGTQLGRWVYDVFLDARRAQ